MGGPNSINLNNPIQGGGYNPRPTGAQQAPNLKELALTIDDFRQFASGKYNAGAAPGGRVGAHRAWERLESANIDPSEASAIRLAFAFALEDAGVSGAKMAAACKRLGLEADFSFSEDDAKVYTAISREEVRDIIEQSLGGRGRVEAPKAEEPRILKNVALGPLLPDDEEPRIQKEEQKVKPPKVEPPKVEVDGAKNLGGGAMPKISSQVEFVAFFQTLTVNSRFGSVSEDGIARDANGEERKTFTYQGLVFRGANRAPDDPSLAEGFKSQNDLSVPRHRTEAMGLGVKAEDGAVGGWGATGKSGVSTGKTLNGAIAYRGGGCTIYVIDTTKIPKGEKAWDMERTVYENGYKVRRNPGDDETMGEVNVSTVPRSAIVGWIKVPKVSGVDNTVDNEQRLHVLQSDPNCKAEFNPDYKP